MDTKTGKITSTSFGRQTNIELLRVVAMLLIVTGHYLYHLKTTEPPLSFSPASIPELTNFCLLQLLYVFTSTGVNLFVLITGYFLAERTDFRLRGMIRVSITTIFYAVVIYLLFCLFGKTVFSTSEFIRNLEPVPVHQYWFVAKYLGLLLVAPFLAMLVSQLDKHRYRLLLAILFLLLFEWPYGELFGGGMSLTWFCFLFLVGGYLHRYGLPLHRDWLAVIIVALLIFALHTVTDVLTYLKSGAPFVLKYDANNSVTFFLALLVFVCFARRQFSGRLWRRVALIAPYTFGVYLFHEYSLMRIFLWEETAPLILPRLPLFIHVLVISVLVFLCGIIIDYIRTLIFKLLPI